MTIAPLSRRAALRTSELGELKIGKRGGMKDLPARKTPEAPQQPASFSVNYSPTADIRTL